MVSIRTYFLNDGMNNAGDVVTKPILEWLGYSVTLETTVDVPGKLLGVGSLLYQIRSKDVVWGSGCIAASNRVDGRDNTFLAVRGPLTHERIQVAPDNLVYGDPGLLMSLVYASPYADPSFRKGSVAYLPHYVNKGFNIPNIDVIDVCSGWKNVLDEINRYDTIMTSSLHGLVFSEAYGKNVVLLEDQSKQIVGQFFKYSDYFASTGRPNQKFGYVEPLDRRVLAKIQRNLISVVKDGALYDQADILT